MRSGSLFLLASVLALGGCSTDRLATPTGPAAMHAWASTVGLPVNPGSAERYSLAVIGDTPYGDAKLAELPSLITLINGDPAVDVVLHLGDIKAGKASPIPVLPRSRTDAGAVSLFSWERVPLN